MSTRTNGIGPEIHRRVLATVEADGVTRAEAIRRVAKEMDRSVASTSSAFYTAERRLRQEPPAESPHTASSSASTTARRAARSGPRHHRQLFAEMLPLVEAGASIEQAARRFGGEEDVEAIAAGFEEWRRSGDASATVREPVSTRTSRIVDTAARVTSLEAENRVLRAELGRVNLTLARLRAILDSAEE